MDKILKTGDPCPCCGMPIKTDDPDRLLALNWLAYVMGKGAAHEKIDVGQHERIRNRRCRASVGWAKSNHHQARNI